MTLTCQQLAADMSVNEAKGLNAFRCAATALFENVANLALSAYYLLLEFSMESLIKDNFIDKWYPNVCTCKKEIDEFGKWMSGSDNSNTNAKYIGVCSESMQ